MKQGLADAVALSPPFNYLAKKDGFVVLARAYELFSYPPSGLTTSVKKIKDKREEIKRVIRAGIKANGFIRQNRDGAIQVMMEWLKINREAAVATYESVGTAFSQDGNIPEDGLRLFIEEVADASILKDVQRELGITGK